MSGLLMPVLRPVMVLAALLFPAAALAQSLLIENVTLIDGTGRPPVTNASVLVEDGRFTRIVRGRIETDSVDRRIDASGKFLIPGLMDMHIHLDGGIKVTEQGLRSAGNNRAVGIRSLHSYLYSGVTAVYDSGNEPGFIFGLRADQRSGDIVAPRIYATGGIVTYPGSHGSGPGAVYVDDWPEAIEKLDAHIAQKPDLVKFTLEERGWGARPMIPYLPVDLLEKLVEYYNDHGIRSVVHTPSEIRARQAIFAGVDNLAHPVIVGPITEKFARLMAAKKTPMATTLTIGENYSRLVEHPEYLDQPLYRASLPAEEIEKLKTETRAEWKDRRWTWWMKIMTPIAQKNLKMIHDAGGVLVLGTDQTLGPAAHREMALLADAGIPPLDIIRIATLNGAVFLNKADELGSIEEGKIADMVLLNADPAADIGNAKDIAAVFLAGAEVDRGALALPVND